MNRWAYYAPGGSPDSIGRITDTVLILIPTPGATRARFDEMKTEPENAASAVGLVLDGRYRNHQPGRWHPERPARYDAAANGAVSALPAELAVTIAPRPAAIEDIRLVHDPAYVDLARGEILAGCGSLSTGDTETCEQTYDTALLAAGGVLSAVDAVMSARVRTAFCPVRPPGHHASPARGMGFCVFNNVAVAARHLQRRHGLRRVLIVDWDVHHGNGTQDSFCDDPDVLFFSTHQWPHYPGTGAAREQGTGAGKGATINCPLPGGAGMAEVESAFLHALIPAAKRFKPEFVLVSAGFDSMAGDPLGGLRLTARDFAALTGIVLDIAAETAGGRVVSVLEGGYNPGDLESAVREHVRALAGLPFQSGPPRKPPAASSRAAGSLNGTTGAGRLRRNQTP